MRRGFTLLEVVVALAIIAISLVAVIRAQNQGLGLEAETRFTARALFLAEYVLSETGMRSDLAPGGNNGEFEDLDSDLAWRTEITSAGLPGLYRIRVWVHRVDEPRRGRVEPSGIRLSGAGFMIRVRFSTKRRGLTLVDLLIALTILAIILSVVYATFFYQEQGRRTAEASREIYGQGLVIMQRISRDISGAWLPTAASGQTGLVYRFEAGPSGLNCITTAALLTVQTIGPELTEVGYRVEESNDGETHLIRRQDNTLGRRSDRGRKRNNTEPGPGFPGVFLHRIGRTRTNLRRSPDP